MSYRMKDNRQVEYLVVNIPIREAVKDYKAAVQKRQQLERELHDAKIDPRLIANAQFSLEKLWMFLAEFVPDQIKAEYEAGKHP